MRVSKAEFQQLPLRAHALLDGVPLHDAWAFHLRGGGPDRTLSDVDALLNAEQVQDINPIVRLLFKLRWALGRVFGWDADDATLPVDSYVYKLTDEDRARSRLEPGSRTGAFTVVYAFERESVRELKNRTVHAFLVSALTPADGGYTLYWGIYVKPVSGFTRFYMATIDPFRHRFIYPAIIRRVERTWRDAYGAQ